VSQFAIQRCWHQHRSTSGLQEFYVIHGRRNMRDHTRQNRTRPRRRSNYQRRRVVFGLVPAILIFALIVIAAMGGQSGHAQGEGKDVRLIEVKGVIDPQVGSYVMRNIEEAENEGAAAVLITIDTPGGLDEPMREIIKSITNSPLPVITYVYPSGGRAASAGTFIAMASDVIAMAPGTSIGAAHPVVYGADLSTEEGEKILNDAAAYIRALAQASGRNADWAELAVRQSIALSADEALDQGVAEFEAETPEALLATVNGYTTVAKGLVIDTDGASISEASLTLKEQLLHLVLNPNIVYLLFLLGLLALAYELANPGLGIGAITGFAALALAVYALYILPVNYAGIVIIVLGIALLSADLFFPSHGLLSGGGVACLVLGSFLLFDSSASFLKVSPVLNITLAMLTGAFFIFIVRAGIKARNLPDQSGKNAMIGEVGFVRNPLDPMGQVFVHGEIWSAESLDGSSIRAGEEIEVIDISGLMLKVRKTT
jgi:membrane-bound serine protease (ClpP class)